MVRKIACHPERSERRLLCVAKDLYHRERDSSLAVAFDCAVLEGGSLRATWKDRSFEPYVTLSEAKGLYHRTRDSLVVATPPLTPPRCPSGGVTWSFLTEKSKILTEKSEFLTEKFEKLTEGSNFLTEKFTMLTVNPKSTVEQ